MTNKVDFKGIAAKYDLLAYVQQDLGESGKRSGGWHCFQSPFYDDSSPSFAVKTVNNRWTDFSLDENGDILDYIQMRTFGSISRSGAQVLEAARILTCNEKLGEIERKSRPQEAEDTVNYATLENVIKWAQWGDMAADYMVKRAISAKLSKELRLGTQMSFPWTYELSDGTKFKTQSIRYTIPWFKGTQVIGVNRRRDDARIIPVLAQIKESAQGQAVIADIIKRNVKRKWTLENVTNEVLLDRLFGPKYLEVKGSDCSVFGLNLLSELDETGEIMRTGLGAPILKRLAYCLITEGEIDAMSLRSAGYVAVAAKFHDGLNYGSMFSNVVLPIIVKDNDTDKTRPNGSVWNPGEEYAEKMRGAVPHSVILEPPAFFKDANEVVVHGITDRWLHKFRISKIA